MTGTVKFFNYEKGFGFIKDDDNQNDVFVHITDVKTKKTLKQGDEVSFDTEKRKKGICAIEVDLI